MNLTALRRLRRTLSTLEDPQPFCYCVQARDGLPVLYVAERLEPGELLELRRTAKIPTFVRGSVSRTDGQLRFAVTSGPAELLEQDLHHSFLAQLPLDADVTVTAEG
jgi:hypothetical protein